MVALGDVFSVVAFLFGSAFCALAMLIGSAMIFHRRARISESLIQHAGGRSFALGLLLLIGLGFVSLVFFAMPLPLAKLVAWIGFVAILGLSAVGGGGLVLFVANRLRDYDPRLRPFTALTRAALFIVVAQITPVVGWFLILPAVIAIGLGAGIQALFMHHEIEDAAPEITTGF